MPELPEVEMVRRSLEPLLSNVVIENIIFQYDGVLKSNSKQEFIKNLTNQKIISINRLAKYLIFKTSDFSIISHLRMEGKWNYFNSLEEFDLSNKKFNLVIFYLENNKIITFSDWRKFATIEVVKNENLKKYFEEHKIGPEPFYTQYNYLEQKLLSTKRAIKTVLLDQSVMSGIGNIYADEILYHSKILPTRPSNSLTMKEIKDILKYAKDILKHSILEGGSSIRTYESLGKKGNYQNFLQVHQRKDQKCYDDKHFVKKIVVNGRGTFYCEGIQK